MSASAMDSGCDERQLALPGLDDASAAWSVRRSPRARRLSARVFHSGRVEIVAPVRASDRRIAEFVARHREWIDRKSLEGRRRAGSSAAAFPPAALHLAAFGQRWRLHVAGGVGRPRIIEGSPAAAGETGLLTISGEVGEGLRQMLLGWISAHSRSRFEPWLAEVAAHCGFEYSRLQMRLQRTRWGSCSVRGTISLNLCLAFQRPEVVRYLLVHELSHTRHMNHSARFWDCVARHCPQWRTLDRELVDGWRQVPPWVFP